jgi:hypothetical protein
MTARSNILRLAIFALLLSRAPRSVQRVVAYMALGAVITIAVIIFAVTAHGKPRKPILHIDHDLSIGCLNREHLEGFFAAWREYHAEHGEKDVPADTIMGWLERFSTCIVKSNGNLPRSYRFVEKACDLCLVDPIYPDNNERFHYGHMWFSCKAFDRSKE